jgi:hypothetical protein
MYSEKRSFLHFNGFSVEGDVVAADMVDILGSETAEVVNFETGAAVEKVRVKADSAVDDIYLHLYILYYTRLIYYYVSFKLSWLHLFFKLS